ncbi:MAG: hypothetical protein WDO18_17770, partial [Acidobacteriota bacterium]
MNVGCVVGSYVEFVGLLDNVKRSLVSGLGRHMSGMSGFLEDTHRQTQSAQSLAESTASSGL